MVCGSLPSGAYYPRPTPARYKESPRVGTDRGCMIAHAVDMHDMMAHCYKSGPVLVTAAVAAASPKMPSLPQSIDPHRHGS